MYWVVIGAKDVQISDFLKPEIKHREDATTLLIYF